MHQPARTAGSGLSSFGCALSLSVCIHGLLLGAWLHVRNMRDGPISLGQKRGTLMVRLTTLPAAIAPKPSPHVTPAPDTMVEQHHVRSINNLLAALDRTTEPEKPLRSAMAPSPEATPPKPLPEPASTKPNDEADSPPSPTPAQPPTQTASTEPAGARFANLFAPITSRPLGHGHWSARPAHLQADAQAAMQQEQAIQGLRQTVQARTDLLRTDLLAQPLSGVCEIRLMLARQAMHIHCDNEADQARISASLTGMLQLQQNMPSTSSDNCLRMTGPNISWVDCTTMAQTEAP